VDLEIFFAQLINGLALGSIYALVVVGVNLLLLVRGIVHFSYAHIMVISMYVFWMILEKTGNRLALAIPGAIVSATLLTTLTEPVFRPLALRKAFLETVIVALGMGIIFTDIMSHFLHQGLPVSFPPTLTGGGGFVRFGMISFSLAHVYTLAGSIGAVIGLFYLLYRHKLGLAFRAMAQNLDIARLVGIPFNKTGLYSFAIAGVLAGVIAIFTAMTLGSASAALGDSLAIKATVLILFAGMGNLKGGLICALLMGVAEAITMAYLPGRWTEAIVFGTIMIVIIIKPNGLFGTRT
jgi:branched-chain amino acid transport system permease protein